MGYWPAQPQPVVTFYSPTVQTTITATTSLADVDATNAKWVFTAPPSGKVLLSASAYCDVTSTNISTGDKYFWAIHDNSADVADTSQMVHRPPAAGASGAADGRHASEWLVTGLTSGNSYTYKLRHAVDNAVVTGRLLIGSKDAATTIRWGPLVMTSHAVAA